MKTTGLKKILTLGVMTSLCSACAKIAFSPVPKPVVAESKTINVSEVVAYGNKQVDFLLVFDDSNSMLPDLQKLAAELGNFVSSLESSDIDWQMCMTTTRSKMVNGVPVWGSSFDWTGYSPSGGVPKYLLKTGTPSLDSIFVNTVNDLTIGSSGSGDERGIKATYQHFKAAASHSCYRPGAALSVIIVSNEDERSVGGDATKLKSRDATGTLQPLESEDMPANLVALSKTVFGSDLRFTFNSIIVRPNDTACEAAQDAGPSPSHPGYIYDQMSNLTEGGVGSVCDTNFASSLNTFKDKIVNSMTDLKLQCVPEPGTMRVSINGNVYSNFVVKKNILKFSTPLIEGTQLDLSFDCK